MGFISKTHDRAAAREATDAQEAWDAGRLGYVQRAFTPSGLPSDDRLTALLDAVLAVGWKLNSTAALDKMLIFTFTRP